MKGGEDKMEERKGKEGQDKIDRHYAIIILFLYALQSCLLCF